VKDAEWIAQYMQCGLLRPSYEEQIERLDTIDGIERQLNY